MPLVIEGGRYFTAVDVIAVTRATCQTLWSRRQEGKVPVERRFLDKQVLFTAGEAEKIREYANRMESLASTETYDPSRRMEQEDAHGA